MKDPTIMALSAAGLLHDLGKFAERAGAVEKGQPDEVRQEYNYAHAHHTALALEQCFGDIVNRGLSGYAADENLNNLASRHHKPRTALEKIIQKADWVASGHERREADTVAQAYETKGRERKSQIPLIAILGRIALNAGEKGYFARYRLCSFSDALADPERLFPVADKSYAAADVQRDYQTLWQGFLKSTGSWKEKNIDPATQIDALLDLLLDYQWCLPASTRAEELPDISLFEHNKAVAAIASALYQFQKEKKDLLDDLGQDNENKFLLCGCDISGIQNFIYQISSKGAYRHLKGRSFYIQLLAEIVAHELLNEQGLSAANLLYASGGKAYLLLANTEKARQLLAKQHKQLNHQLSRNFGQELYLRLASVSLSVNDLCRQQGRTLSVIWDELTRTLGAQGRMRLQNLDNDELATLFAVEKDYPKGDCKICHAPLKEKNEGTCRTCEQLGELGRKLGNAKVLQLSQGNGLLPGKWVAEPLPSRQVSQVAQTDRIYTLNQLAHSYVGNNAASLMVGGNQHPQDDFESIAALANGVARLGILRMDVDNLGSIFANGLKNYVHGQGQDNQGRSTRFHSLGRVTTLSWQLSTFFSAVLRTLVEKHPANNGRASIVYAGGDDLFILGAWDALPPIATDISRQFVRYCAGNPLFSLSGGLALTGGKFPIYKGAELAGDAEHRAKAYKRPGKEQKQDKTKHAFCFFDTPLDWQEFDLLSHWFERLSSHFSDPANRPLLRHLQRIAGVWDGLRQQKVLAANKIQGRVDLRQIAQSISAEKWCWQMVYSLSRYTRSRPEAEDLVEELKKFILQPVNPGPRQGIELLGLLCRWTELYLRKPQDANERRAS